MRLRDHDDRTHTAREKCPGLHGLRHFVRVRDLRRHGRHVLGARPVVECLQGIRGQLPEGVNPVIGPDAAGVGWVFEYALVDETGRHTLAELRTFQDWLLRYWLASCLASPKSPRSAASCSSARSTSIPSAWLHTTSGFGTSLPRSGQQQRRRDSRGRALREGLVMTTRISSPARPCEREQERVLFECLDLMGHALIEREQTAGAQTERPA